jgi:hypothetical protein
MPEETTPPRFILFRSFADAENVAVAITGYGARAMPIVFSVRRIGKVDSPTSRMISSKVNRSRPGDRHKRANRRVGGLAAGRECRGVACPPGA